MNFARSATPEWLADASWASFDRTDLQHGLDASAAHDAPRWPAMEGLINGLRYRLLADVGPQVRAGCPGWLYLAEETVEVQDGGANLVARIGIAQKLAREFRDRGVRLLIVPVPDKVSETDIGRCGLAVSAQASHRLDAWRNGTARLDAIQVDADARWPKPGFWRTDTHWDRTGSRYVAALIATAGAAVLTPADHAAVTLDPAGPPQERPGDLVTLAGLDRSPRWLAPAPEMEQVETARVTRAGGLLDAADTIPVILAGTSYSLNSGFIDYLEVALQAPVLQLSQLGGGFSGAILDLLEHRPALLQSAKLVIWEWPERALTLPLTAEEVAYLKSEKAE